MNPANLQDLELSPLADSALHALASYVELGRSALEAFAAGSFDDAMDLMERRKFVLHNFRVHDGRLEAAGLKHRELEEQLARLGDGAMQLDAALMSALAQEQMVLRDAIADVGNRRKIGRYRSGQTDRPVVEREV